MLQRLLVIIALIVIGVVLSWLMLCWGTEYDCWNCQRILFLYERPDPRYPKYMDEVGIFTGKGIPPILAILGVVLPLCLFAVATFLALGRRKT